MNQYFGSQNVLVLNPGSSNLKWGVYQDVFSEQPETSGISSSVEVKNLMAKLSPKYDLQLTVVRIVHGGQISYKPHLVTTKNISALRKLNDLAPLHNPVGITTIEALIADYPYLTVIAVFDTEFFEELPTVAQVYGLPVEIRKKYNIRRYGFHGFAHASMLNYWQCIHSNGREHKIVTIQLGSGCSMTAIVNGKPIDTSMGFTPNEGLLMRTRCGDLDPGLLTWLQRKEGWCAEKADRILNQESGWSGMSGGIHHMAELLTDNSDDGHLAVALFLHRIRKTLGGFYALLGGLDGVILSGGIAENNIKFCCQLLAYMQHLGICISKSVAMKSFTADTHPQLPLCISNHDSSAECWIISVDEAAEMLHSVRESGYFHNRSTSILNGD